MDILTSGSQVSSSCWPHSATTSLSFYTAGHRDSELSRAQFLPYKASSLIKKPGLHTDRVRIMIRIQGWEDSISLEEPRKAS